MPEFLIDEDLPRSLAKALRNAGLSAFHVPDRGLRGASDAAILEHAVTNEVVLLTGDLGFANLLRFPLGTHCGIDVVRFPNEVPASMMAAATAQTLKELSAEELRGSLAIIEPGRVRLRRPQ